ncbi:RNA-directed DNA polymerase, eukaryota, reverse transcriptase zinc-binding domain protein, partial [Tanacetum coccineum]
MVYASNSYTERRLWKDLGAQKVITNKEPWVILGDFNATLKIEEQSNGSSIPSNEMNEFAESIRATELDDILSYEPMGNLGDCNADLELEEHRDDPSLLKVDRILINESFMDNFQTANGIFLPYLISDHSPAILRLPNGMAKRRKAFSWKDGNIFERVTKLKVSLEDVQAEVDKYPHNEEIKAKSCKILSEYYEALKDENDLLMQKAILIVKDGERFENDQVAGQFVKHFEQFLGKKDEVIEMPKDRIIFPNKLKIEEIDMMSRDVSDVEVKNAMFDIEDSKAPGLLDSTKWKTINDQYIVCKELFKGLYRKQKIKKVAFKIDLQKAYDTISWNFLKVVLEQFGFPDKMVKWIMVCVSTAKFTININGERVGYFSGGRGLRQGDPMSPYLFTLVMEAFNLIMRKNIKDTAEFKFHHGCQKLGITHLCFADDLLVFCHGDHKSVNVIKKALEEFSSYSGLKANMGKLPVRYLGVPLLTKKITATDCKPLVEKVKSRILDWRNKALSYSGRLQLIASVLSAMQIYWASVFLLPKNVIYEINKLLKGFLWCQGEMSKGKAKISWKSICRPKEQGGLGIKNLQVWNEVLLIKQLWNVIAKKDTLWVKWVNSENLKGKSIWVVTAKANSSAGWKEILSLRDKVRKHILGKTGDGMSINTWSIGPICDFVTSREIYEAGLNIDTTI